MTLQKRDNWFEGYHAIPELGIEGKRQATERIGFFDENDFKGSAVIDVGCNIGQMSFEAEKMGAARIVGVEYDKTAYSKSLELKTKLNSNVTFVLDDIDNPLFWTSVGKFDIGLFLSVIDTQELTNRFGILSKLASKVDILYFEGHNKQPCSKYMKYLTDYTDFSQIEFKGHVQDDNDQRAFIRCSRSVLTTEEAAKKVIEVSKKYNRIAIIGKGYAGKTHLRKQFENSICSHLIIDDLKDRDGKWYSKDSLGGIEKLIFVDYRAFQYTSGFDAVFYVTPSEEYLDDSGRHKECMRSQSIRYDFKEFYTVVSR